MSVSFRVDNHEGDLNRNVLLGNSCESYFSWNNVKATTSKVYDFIKQNFFFLVFGALLILGVTQGWLDNISFINSTEFFSPLLYGNLLSPE
jgi:hypothetical protein